MRHIKKSSLCFLILLYAALMSACSGGGGSSSSSTAASATTSTTGAITGFGSVIVNGIEFSRKSGMADNLIAFNFEDGTLHSEKDLRAGMIVTITGTVDTTGKKGEFEAITFNPEVRGPIGLLTDIDLVNNSFKLLGMQVLVEPGTVFENVTDLADIQVEVQAGKHPVLEISGNFDASGVLHATRIAQVSADFQNNGMVELKTTISTVGTNSFVTSGGITVNFSGTTMFKNMMAADLAVGLKVEVKGTFDSTTNTITATAIEKKKAIESEMDEDARIEGVAAGAIVNNSFMINGENGPITVTTNAATVIVGTVAAGVKVELEGALQADGSFLASRIEVEVDKTVKLSGNLAAATDIDTTASTIILNGVTVSVIAETKLLDGPSMLVDLTAFKAALAMGSQHLQISGFLDASGQVVAAMVQRTNASTKTFIQGPVSAAANPNLTILGIAVVTDATATKFGGNEKFTMTQATFFAGITPGSTIVKAKGVVTGTTMTATEVDIEIED